MDIFAWRSPDIRISRAEQKNTFRSSCCCQMRNAAVVSHKEAIGQNRGQRWQRKVYGEANTAVTPLAFQNPELRLIGFTGNNKQTASTG